MYWKPQRPAMDSGTILESVSYQVGYPVSVFLDKVASLYASGMVNGYIYRNPEPGIYIVGFTTDRPYYKLEITLAPRSAELSIGSMATASGPTNIISACKRFDIPEPLMDAINEFDNLIRTVVNPTATGGHTRLPIKRHVSIYVGSEYRALASLQFGLNNDYCESKISASLQPGDEE